MIDTTTWTRWQKFWHAPVRAERLAFTRVLVALALFTDQLVNFFPNFEELYGPAGFYPAGLQDEWLLSTWRWTALFFYTDNLTVVYSLFFVWVGATLAFLVGWKTRFMNVIVWLLSVAFINRTHCLRTGAEEVLLISLFLLMFAPSGYAFSLDQRARRRRMQSGGGKGHDLAALTPIVAGPVYTPAWPLRLLQIQLCMIYLATGLAKLLPPAWNDGWFNSTWWDGTSLHYVLCKVHMTHWSFAQLPLPLWVTAPMTYVAVWWEVLFPLLVSMRWTRKWALWFGVLFHISIYLCIEVGWFSFYTLALYGSWIPGEFWDRWRKKGPLLGE